MPQFEETLDPADWHELRELGHAMVDQMFDYLSTVRDRPVWQQVPSDVRERLGGPLPLAPTPAAEVFEEFKRDVLPYPTGNIHPRFWGWVMGTGSPVAMLADLLASGMNAHVAGYDQSASLVERQVLRWLTELLEFPPESTGVLTSGGTIANLIGVTVARHAHAGFDVRSEGLRDAPQMTVYCSAETHGWSQKAVELLGLGNASLRRIPVTSEFTMDLAALQMALAADRARGLRPICVIGTAGTVNTGATDDLAALTAICRREGVWFHVDGAFGALVKLSSHAEIVAGLEQADSVALDLHKWMYMPFEAGCVLVRDAAAHRNTFAMTPTYLHALNRGITKEPLEFAARGLDLSRGFKALKIWFSLKVHGARLFGRLIDQNIAQARHLAELIRNDESLQLLAPVPLNVVCFRYRPAKADEERIDAMNREILLRIQESGIAMPSSTVVHGHFALRVAITNHRSRREDFARLASLVVRLGKGLEQEQERP